MKQNKLEDNSQGTKEYKTGAYIGVPNTLKIKIRFLPTCWWITPVSIIQ